MQITVKDRQCLLDIAVQYLGGASGVFALAERNGISITSRLTDGQVLEYELADTVNATVQNYYTQRGISPATDISNSDTNILLTATAKYYRGCIIPALKHDWGIVDIDNAAGSYTLPTLGTQLDGGTNVQTDDTTDKIQVNTVSKVVTDLSAGEEVVSESGTTLARIFSNQFNDDFA